jgi:sugar phosphate isomerase/epimerase
VQLAIIPDEYTYDPFTAFELGRGWGIEHFEIRYAYRWRVPHAPAWAGDLVANAAKAYDVTVTAISPGLFKPVMRTDGSQIPISTETPGEVRRHLDELLPRQFEFAHRLGTKNITVFALPKPPEAPPERFPPIVVESLAEAAQKAAAEGFTLFLENCTGLWADTGRATAALVSAVGSKSLKVTWDPANVVYSGPAEEPVSEGYPAVQAHVGNVHVKDATFTDAGHWVQMGEGAIDWANQLARLREDGYSGFLTLEPHLQYEPGVTHLLEKMEVFAARVREMLDA